MNFEGNLGHSNLRQAFPHFAQYFMTTVDVHLIHHSEDRALQDSNFAPFTPLLDVIFGTYKHPARHPVISVGLPGNQVPSSFIGQILLPVSANWKSFRRLCDSPSNNSGQG